METLRAYWAASAKSDWRAAHQCVGPGYLGIDHATGVRASSADELREATEDAMPWSEVEFDIENVFEAQGGVLIVQAIWRGNLSGEVALSLHDWAAGDV